MKSLEYGRSVAGVGGGGAVGGAREVVEGDGGVSLGEVVDVGRGGGVGKRAIGEENCD